MLGRVIIGEISPGEMDLEDGIMTEGAVATGEEEAEKEMEIIEIMIESPSVPKMTEDLITMTVKFMVEEEVLT